jgi:hypothetical protein
MVDLAGLFLEALQFEQQRDKYRLQQQEKERRAL